jgi:hypothetical protein
LFGTLRGRLRGSRMAGLPIWPEDMAVSDWRARWRLGGCKDQYVREVLDRSKLRVFVGVDPETRRKRYRSVTFRGKRAEVERELNPFLV